MTDNVDPSTGEPLKPTKYQTQDITRTNWFAGGALAESTPVGKTKKEGAA